MSLARSIALLRSSKLALALLFVLAAVAALGSVRGAAEGTGAPTDGGYSIGRFLGLERTFASPIFVGLVALLTGNILFCTWHRARASGRAPWLRASDVLLHLSLVLVIAGGAVRSVRGFVGTQNVPVGTETATVYDWRAGADAPLGFLLKVERLVIDYHPFHARIGISDPISGAKLGIVEVSEGRPAVATAAGAAVGLLGIDREWRRAGFTARTPRGEGPVTLSLVPGPDAAADFGGVRFTLVAYRDEEKSVRALVNALAPSGVVVEKWLSTNGSLAVGDTDVFLTAWGRDAFGNPFVGLQASRDPGAPLFWFGCVLLAGAAPLHFVLKLIRRGQPGAPRS